MNIARVICFSHPKYDGRDSPILTCKVCCSIFVHTMRSLTPDFPNYALSDEIESKSTNLGSNLSKELNDHGVKINPSTI